MASSHSGLTSSSGGSITPGQQVISSWSGALLTSLMTTPFDVVKVRIQTQQQSFLAVKPCYVMDCMCLDGVTVCTVTADGTHIPRVRFNGTLDGLIKIAKLEGLQSWWKGLSPTLLMAVPMTVIYYTGYDQLKQTFGFRSGQRNYLAPALAGSIARTIAVSAVCPIELIRTKLQSRQGYGYRELMSVVRNAVRQNGVLSLWRGLSPMLLRDVPFSILYWVGYEFIKLKLLQSHMGSVLPTAVPFLSGCVSGTISAIITNPLDVVKTHMQVGCWCMCEGCFRYVYMYVNPCMCGFKILPNE